MTPGVELFRLAAGNGIASGEEMVKCSIFNTFVSDKYENF